MLLLALTLSAALASPPPGCVAGTRPLDIAASVTAAESAYADLDAEGFARFTVHAREQLRCLETPLPPGDIAALHRLGALEAWLDGDEQATLAALAASRMADPTQTLPSRLAPADHPLRALYERAGGTGESPPRTVPVPPDTTLYVDGALQPVPADRPALLQLRGPDEQILRTAWVPAGAPTPDWPGLTSTPTRPPEVEASQPVAQLPAAALEPPLRRPWLVAAGAGAAVSGGLYLVAWRSSLAFDDPSNPEVSSRADLEALQRRSNALAWTSLGLGAASLGLGVTTVVLGPTSVSVRW